MQKNSPIGLLLSIIRFTHAMKELHFSPKRAFEDLETLCSKIGNRLSGTKGEKVAVTYIKNQFNKHETDCTLEEFETDVYKSNKAYLLFKKPKLQVVGKPIWMSKNTPKSGLEGKGLYLGPLFYVDRLKHDDIKDKIVFTYFLRNYSTKDNMEKIVELSKKNPKAIVILCHESEDYMRSNISSEQLLHFRDVPTMIASVSKFDEIRDKLNETDITIFTQGEMNKGYLHNVIKTIEGEKEETILICAHHDTVENTVGTRDNASGVSILLEVYRALAEQDLRYTYKFITFGGEERGLLGSKLFLENHNKEHFKLCINIDVVEPTPGFNYAMIAVDEQFLQEMKGLAQQQDYPTGIYDGIPPGLDAAPFVYNEIPAISMTFRGRVTGKTHHTIMDNMEYMNPKSLGITGKFILKIIERLENQEIKLPTGIKQEVLERFQKEYSP